MKSNKELFNDVSTFTLVELSALAKLNVRGIVSKQRRKKVVACRYMYIYLMREYTGRKYKDIMDTIGGGVDSYASIAYYKIKFIVDNPDCRDYIGPYSSKKIKSIINEIINRLKIVYGENYNKNLGSSHLATYHWGANGFENERVDEIGVMLSKFSRQDAPQEEA